MIMRKFFLKVATGSENLYLNIPEHIKYKAENETRDARMAKKIQSAFPLHSFHRLAPVLSKLRMIKEPGRDCLY